MYERYIPTEAPELADYLVWMIATMPEFQSSMMHDWNADIAFDVLKQGVTEFCKEGPEAFCCDNMPLIDLAKGELEKGDEQASYEILNQMYQNFIAFMRRHKLP